MYRTALLLMIAAALVGNVFAQSEEVPTATPSGRQLKVFTNADGTGTANRLALWIDSDTLGDSQIYQVSGNIGIGVTNPSQPLEVNGNVRVVPANGAFSVGGTAPAGYPFFATSTAGGVSSAIQLTSSFSTLATSYIGNFGQFGTYISHNREPQAGLFTNAAASPNQANAVQLVVGDTHPARMRLFSIANYPGGVETPRLVVNYAGNVGIGTTDPTRKLTVISNTNNVGALLAQATTTHTTNATTYDVAAMGLAYQNVSAGATNSGSATGYRGAGQLTGGGVLASATGVRAEVSVEGQQPQAGTVTDAYALSAKVTKNAGTIDRGYGLYIGNIEATTDWGVYQGASDDDNYFAGRVFIGTATPTTSAKFEVSGDAHVTGTLTGGNIQAKYQDLAEWVPAAGDFAPGTVVVLDPAIGNGVMPSGIAYDTTVAGVVSAQPGIILGEAGDGKELIATTGRVRVRVDATRAAIRVGDLLVTSDKPGVAMRSTPIDVAGIAMHRPGTIVGKALEALNEGEGEILVLLSLQ